MKNDNFFKTANRIAAIGLLLTSLSVQAGITNNGQVPIASLNTIPTYNGVSTTLDTLRVSNLSKSFQPIFQQIDQQMTVNDLQSFLGTLIPEEAKGGIIETGVMGFRLPLEEIIGSGGRFDQLRAGFDSFKTGYNAGDMIEGEASYGPLLFGSSAKQGKNNGVDGYTAATLGFGFLADAPVLDNVRVGVAAAYSGDSVRRSGITRNLTLIQSVQGMLYGSVCYGPLFLDGVLSIGHNNYRGTRNIKQLGGAATSNYQGNQYGGKLKGGFIIPISGIEISPTGTVEYYSLNRGAYTEKGISGANLTLGSRQVSNTQIGIGVRIADTSQYEEFLPEVHAMYLYDVKQASLQVTSQFVNGGGAFVSQGPLPAKSGTNVGISISARLLDDLLVTGAYDFVSKKSFMSHSASIKFRKLF